MQVSIVSFSHCLYNGYNSAKSSGIVVVMVTDLWLVQALLAIPTRLHVFRYVQLVNDPVNSYILPVLLNYYLTRLVSRITFSTLFSEVSLAICLPSRKAIISIFTFSRIVLYLLPGLGCENIDVNCQKSATFFFLFTYLGLFIFLWYLTYL
jgi:hypothetical protein